MKKLLSLFVGTALAVTMLVGCAAQKEPDVGYEENVVMIKSVRNTNIKAVMTVPVKENKDGYPIVILAHGFMGSRDESGSFTEVAQGLAEKGIASIRLDFPGCNESEESFNKDYTLDNMNHDMVSVLDYAKKEIKVNDKKIGILGYSMGGRVATLSTKDIDVNTMVLWAPAVSDGLDAAQFMGTEKDLNKSIADSEKSGIAKVSVWGEEVEVSRDLLIQIRDSNPTKLLNNYKGNLLFVIGGTDDVVVASISQAGIDAAIHTNITAVTEIPRIGHGLGSYDGDDGARKVAVSTTVNFFADYLK